MAKIDYSKSQQDKQTALGFPDRVRAIELIVAANTFALYGVSPIPTQPGSKVVRYPWRHKETPADRETIARWFSNGRMNLSVVCGSGGLLVLDFDDLAYLARWQIEAGVLANTYTEITSRGIHLFYQVDNPITRRFVECEALGSGHLCMVAPSIHPSGHVYYSPDPGAEIRKTETARLFSLLSDLPVPVKPSVSIETPPDTSDLVSPINKIKAAFPLLSYVKKLTDVSPSSKDGQWYLGRCPLHDDEQPSFYVDAKRQIWRCYSPSCVGYRGGDVVNLYALRNNITIAEAIKRLKKEVLCPAA